MNDDSALVEQLSDKVHQAWAAEKQRQGFADHPYQGEWIGNSGRAWCGFVFDEHGGKRTCEEPQRLHHTDMLPYADLAENIKEYDRATVRTVLGALREAGYLIVPNMTVPA